MADASMRDDQRSKPPSREAASPPREATSPPREATSPYRTDLDGLRGIAIALVACFHVWFGRVSGGVDVFLTLSGYFFIGSLVRHAVHSRSPLIGFGETISPWPRLKRLLRRLLPALYTVLIAVVVLTVIVIPQTRWQNVGREVFASALYFQNFHLAANSQDYLAASSANSPLQHLWSMSMQGQFFVGALLVLLAVAGVLKALGIRFETLRRPAVIRAVFATLIGAVAIASFAWAQHRMPIDQPYNYYDTFARLWEPLVGGLLAIWMPSWRMSTRIRSAVTVFALALIATCGWWIDGVAHYPAALAWVPVGATLLIIWAGQVGDGQDRPAANRVLAGHRAVWLGSLSYSLYLIHWPLLIFYLTWRGTNHANFVEGTAILAVSLGLSWVMKRYVEDPLRGGGRSSVTHVRWRAHPRLTYPALVTVLLVAASAGTAGAITAWDRHVSGTQVDTADLDPTLFPGARALLNGAPVPALDPQPTPLAAASDLPQTFFDGVMVEMNVTVPGVGVYGDRNGKRTVALVGGSHSEMWLSAIDAIAQRNGIKVVTYVKRGCPLTVDENPAYLERVPYPECFTWNQAVMADLLQTRPDAVITNSTRPTISAPGDFIPQGYISAFEELTDAGIPVVGIRDTPWPHNDQGPIDTPNCLSAGGTATSCGTDRASALSAVDPGIEYAARNRLFHTVDLTDGVCTVVFCPAIVGNIMVYRDPHHLTQTYVRTLTAELQRQMGLVLPWTATVPVPR